MTPQEIQIKVAEECGWIWHEDSLWFKMGDNYYWKLGNVWYQTLPPYTTSLDAIQKVALERFKKPKHTELFKFYLAVQTHGKCDWIWQLTALDWCEAFLATCEQLKQ